METERWGSGRLCPRYKGRPVLSVAGFTRPNVLNCLPKSLQSKAALQQIWMAPTRGQAHRAFDRFVATHKAKYPKATERLKRDREALDQAQGIRGVKFSGVNPVVANEGDVEDGLISRSAVNQALFIHQL